MMHRFVWLYLLPSLLWMGGIHQSLFGQNFSSGLEAVLDQYGQTYVTVLIRNSGEIERLSQLATIDRIKGDTAVVSVTPEQLAKLDAAGVQYRHTPLHRPSHTEMMLPPEGEAAAWNYYPTWPQYDSIMQGFATQFPGLCQPYTFHTLTSGRKLIVSRLTSALQPAGFKPLFFYSATIHGDETAGYILMLRLMDHLLNGYGSDPEATWLLDHLEIWICPLANPDGTYYGGNHTVANARRGNAANIDLNRNFPDPRVGANPDQNPYQPETNAFRGLADTIPFAMGANLHGGAEVLNYPWDTWYKLHPDNNWWIEVARPYADTVHVHAPVGFFTDEDNGITNGAAWYVITGGRQDYMNYFAHCREVTLELSATKLVPASQLNNMWDYHHRSLINFIKEGWYGFRGVVTDSVTGLPLKAKVWLNGHDADSSHVWSSGATGFYSRPVYPGTYSLTFSAPGYHSKTVQASAASKDTTVVNVQLVPVGFGIENISSLSRKVYYDAASEALRFEGFSDNVYDLGVFSIDGKLIWSSQSPENTKPLRLGKGVWLVTYVSAVNGRSMEKIVVP